MISPREVAALTPYQLVMIYTDWELSEARAIEIQRERQAEAARKGRRNVRKEDRRRLR